MVHFGVCELLGDFREPKPFFDFPRRLGIALPEVEGCGETVGLVLTALKGMDRGTEGFPFFANFKRVSLSSRNFF